VPFPHLVGAGDPQSVEKRHKDLGGDDRHDGVREAEEPEGNPEPVSLGRRADDRDARHEAGSERHGDRHGRHLPSAQQELGAARLLAAPDGLEKADARCPQDGSGKHHIIPHRESGHGATGPDHAQFSFTNTPI